MAEQTATAPTLEQRIDRLQAIVERLERDDLELEEALALFEEGVGHVRAARELLGQGELRIQRLVDEGDDGARLEPLERDDE